MLQKPAYSIEELTDLGPLGRSKLYEAIRDGSLVARKAGRRTIVLKADYENFLQNLPVSRAASAAQGRVGLMRALTSASDAIGLEQGVAEGFADAPKRITAPVGGRGGEEKGSEAAPQWNRDPVLSLTASPNYGEPVLEVSDGRDLLASIFPSGDAFAAVLADGKSIGVFATLKAAREAIAQARRAAP